MCSLPFARQSRRRAAMPQRSVQGACDHNGGLERESHMLCQRRKSTSTIPFLNATHRGMRRMQPCGWQIAQQSCHLGHSDPSIRFSLLPLSLQQPRSYRGHNAHHYHAREMEVGSRGAVQPTVHVGTLKGLVHAQTMRMHTS